MRTKLGILLMIVIGLITGCSSDVSMEPVDIDAGTDSCDMCHMGIEDLASASQVIMEDGTPKKFDDIGCMLLYYQEHKDDVGVAYVPDWETGEWLNMEDAVFVQESSIETPMSYGIIAFSSEEKAQAFQEERGGELYNGTEITQLDVKALKADGHGEHSAGDESHE